MSPRVDQAKLLRIDIFFSLGILNKFLLLPNDIKEPTTTEKMKAKTGKCRKTPITIINARTGIDNEATRTLQLYWRFNGNTGW